MGDRGTRTSRSGDLVLDAGALIAFERGGTDALAIINGAVALDLRVVIPATALAQAWRGGPRSAHIARLIDASEVDSLDETRAKEVGVRLGSRGASDVADAHAVCCAFEHQARVVTSDSEDIGALAQPGERLSLISV